jgi:hypothetical protein
MYDVSERIVHCGNRMNVPRSKPARHESSEIKRNILRINFNIKIEKYSLIILHMLVVKLHLTSSITEMSEK